MRKWLLPEFVEDVLPPQAWRIERLRRAMLDCLRAHGYQLIMPPLMEYVDSLLVGAGHDLDLATFKLVDQLSGRHMGLRADITPQAARIDAHLLNRQGVNRLCYAGSVLRTLPDALMRTREPLQVGAELFGHAGLEGDAEIQALMLEVLRVAGVERVLLDLGHVGILRALAQRAELTPEREAELFSALQAKDICAVGELVKPLDAQSAAAFALLPTLSGDARVLDQALRALPDMAEISAALADLRALGRRLARGQVSVSFDLAELRGYHYHSGVVFAAYAEGHADALARGGRYDEVGKAFGRARPATGFSLDLRELAGGAAEAEPAHAILAPCDDDTALARAIADLRAQGEAVVLDLPGHETTRTELGCDRRLVQDGRAWRLEPFEG